MKKGIKCGLIGIVICGCLGMGILVGMQLERCKPALNEIEVKKLEDSSQQVKKNSQECLVSTIEPSDKAPYDMYKISADTLLEEYKQKLEDEKNTRKKVEEENRAYIEAYCKDIDSYILEKSSECLLNTYDYIDLDPQAARLARNEIYARHGYIFNEAEYQEVFQRKSWYKPLTHTASEIQLSAVESYNITCLKWWEEEGYIGQEGLNDTKNKSFTDCYRFNVNQTFTMDLNEDGILEEISCKLIMDNNGGGTSNCLIEVNGNIQDTWEGNFASYIWVVDVDPYDGYKELVIYDEGPSDDPLDTYYYYDGEKLINMGSVGGHLNETDYIKEGILHAVKRFDILGTARYEWNYELALDHTWQEIPRDFLEKEIPIIAQQEIDIYSSADVSSIQKHFPAGTAFMTLGTDLKEWIKVKLKDGSEGWINTEEYPSYELGGLFFAD